MGEHGKPIRGFTLLELVIAMAVAAIVLAALHAVFTYHRGTLAMQERGVEAQQNARAALQLMTRDIVMAGYSSELGAPPVPVPGVAFAHRTSLTVRYGVPGVLKRYGFSRYSGNRIGRRENDEEGAGLPSRSAVADHVRSLTFTYFDASGNPLTPDMKGEVNPADVRLVRVNVHAVTPPFAGYSSSCTLETDIAPRNL